MFAWVCRVFGGVLGEEWIANGFSKKGEVVGA